MKLNKIICIILSVGFIGCLILIIGLFNKKENIVSDETTIELVKIEPNTTSTTRTTTTKKTTKKVTTTKKKVTKMVTKNKSNGYRLTHYGWDCCKSGVTATGYHVRNTIYYNDSTYGKVRIVAMNKDIPLYSIIKIKNYKLGGDVIAIVLDRGVGSGVIDLLVENEKKSSKLGIQNNVQIEILRKGRG